MQRGLDQDQKGVGT